jgi:hypothetical protein
MKARSAAIALATLLAAASSAQAQTRCHEDQAGNSMCRAADGGWIKGHTDANGNSVWRDSAGHTVVGRQTATGESVYRDNRGNTVVGHTDANGNSIYRGADGAAVVGRSHPVAPSAPAVGPVHCRTYANGASTCPSR